MTLAKIVVDGVVTKAPEKRFTQNNLPITSFTMDINQNDETLIRVFTMGNAAENVAENVGLGDRVIVEGRPQVDKVKTDDGRERNIIEINASMVDKIGAGADMSKAAAPVKAAAKSTPVAAANKKDKEIVQFANEEIVEDLIDEDEIPF